MQRPIKQLKFNQEAQDSLIKGVNILADAVGATLGARGRNVAFTQDFGEPKVVHDGVSVAKEIYLEDPVENMGAQLVKGAATRTNEVSGDGTTTSTVLARAIVNEAYSAITKGENSRNLKEEISKTAERIVSELDKLATPVTGPGQIAEVARISAQNEKIGDIVAEAVNKVGKDGIITVEEGSQIECEVQVTTGMQFDRGYVSPAFFTNGEDMSCEIEEPYILFYDGRISDEDEILEFVQNIVPTTKNIAIIANKIEGNALRFLAANHLKKNIKTVAVRSPGFGNRAKNDLMDMAILTGGTLITDDSGISLSSVEVKHLGRADKIVSTETKTTIIGGAGDPDKIKDRETFIRKELEDAKDDWNRDQIQKRLARLVGGIGVIYAGAATELEMLEVKEAIIDAVGATQAAIEQGVVQGGETALIVAARKALSKKDPADMSTAETIMWDACYAPFYQLIKNAEIEDNPRMKLRGRVLDVRTGRWRDAYRSGIIDPVKVVKTALVNAVSVANMILSTAVSITDKEEENAKTN